MRIVVLGAGTVGTSIADLLCQNRHSVTVVDSDADHARRINAELDVRAIHGSASQSSVLFQTDISSADICLAVTGDDEANIVGASMAKAMGARRTLARVYAPVFSDLSTFDYQRHFGIDRFLSLEHLSAMELARGISNPGAVLLENFTRGDLEVQEVLVNSISDLIDQPLSQLDFPPGLRAGSIYRDSRVWIPGPSDEIRAGDRVSLIGAHEVVQQWKQRFQVSAEPKLSVVIAGGGETGLHLARKLERDNFDVTVMDECEERCDYLSRSLTFATIINADATRRAVLEEERIGSADVFVACTGDDENNIMAGVEAREIGAGKIMAIVGRPDYANVVAKLGIDLAVSEREVTAKQVLGFLNKGAVISRTPLPGGRIGVFEIEVIEGAPATEHVLANLPLPRDCLLAAVVRQDYARVPQADDRLVAGDTVVALIDDAAVEAALEQFRA